MRSWPSSASRRCTRTTRCAPCRAAVEMRDALPELGVQARIGVNTGEVVTGTEERLATGDAVNVAARLEQAAQPGEVLIGETTLALVRDAVATEPVEPLALKGKTEPVAASRLLAVHEPTERRAEAPMVGRERELDRLRDAFDQASREPLLPAVHDPGDSRCREVAAGARVPRRSRRPDRRRPLPLLRRGDHVLAGGRGGEAAATRFPPTRRQRQRSARCWEKATRERRRTRSPGPSASCSRSGHS